jgi:hypothetical protein
MQQQFAIQFLQPTRRSRVRYFVEKPPAHPLRVMAHLTMAVRCLAIQSASDQIHCLPPLVEDRVVLQTFAHRVLSQR